jgi:hypothetical protein
MQNKNETHAGHGARVTRKLLTARDSVRCSVGHPSPDAFTVWKGRAVSMVAAFLFSLSESFAESYRRKWEAGRAVIRDGLRIERQPRDRRGRAVMGYDAANAYAVALANAEQLGKTSAGAQSVRWAVGRKLDDCEVEEIAAIYHAHFVGAWARTGTAPADKHELYRSTSNALPFRALLAWHRAHRAASKQVRSHLWGKGAEITDIQSADALRRDCAELAELWGAHLHSEGSSHGIAATVQRETTAEVDTLAAPAVDRFRVDRSALRRQLRHARWCLRAFHLVGSGSRKWREQFANDSALLRAAVAVARGEGLHALDGLGYVNGGGTAASCALRQAVSRLRVRLGAGDLLLTEQPEAVAEAFRVVLGIRRGWEVARRVVADLLPIPRVTSIAASVPAWAFLRERIASASVARNVAAWQAGDAAMMQPGRVQPGRAIVALVPRVAIDTHTSQAVRLFAESSATGCRVWREWATWRNLRSGCHSVAALLANVRASGNAASVRKLARVRRSHRSVTNRRALFGWYGGDGSRRRAMTAHEYTRDAIAESNRRAVLALVDDGASVGGFGGELRAESWAVARWSMTESERAAFAAMLAHARGIGDKRRAAIARRRLRLGSLASRLNGRN